MASAQFPARTTIRSASGIWSLASAWRFSSATPQSAPAPELEIGLCPETTVAKSTFSPGRSEGHKCASGRLCASRPDSSLAPPGHRLIERKGKRPPANHQRSTPATWS
jgi:hypothetical protein